MREELALSVTVDGQAHFGLYAVESEMMTAWIRSVGSRTCWLKGREPSKVAKLLLQEVSGLMLIIREWAHTAKATGATISKVEFFNGSTLLSATKASVKEGVRASRLTVSDPPMLPATRT